tara:strand:- start:359 stop:811 length:453 start_codon:yes stop_codon:yes gene_type:complete
MSISKDNEQNDEQPQAAVDLEVALKQMKDDGMPPTGFHMMFFSEDFKTTDDCPMNQLLRKIGYTYDFHDTIKRQVFQMPKSTIITYEFAWLGGFDGIQSTLESIDTLLKGQFDKMVEDKVLRQFPQARVSFLTNEAPLDVETEDEDNDLF